MFLIEKYRSPFVVAKKPNPSLPLAIPFEKTLASRLRSLLPIPSSPSPSIPLSWLSRLADLLALTLTDFAALASDPSSPDLSAVASYLDSGVALLDSCNAIAAGLDKLLRRRLHLRLALHHLSRPDPGRARDAIAEWDRFPRGDIAIRGNALEDPPRGKISGVRRAIYAVEAVSRLVATAIVAVLGGGKKESFAEIRVSGEFTWAEEFNKVGEEISSKLGEGFVSEVERVDHAVRRLMSITDVVNDDDGKKTEKVRSSTEEVEKLTEEMTEGLERLSDAVNGVFRSALSSRNAALQSFRVGPRKCK
ncbi:UPF0496 protein 4-like [Typha angustifolia]|uniref:UPF0496 protein 4-like n=1 Tax=Typha angustifolia TaxID=59011 RepID=UPI003C2F8E84